MTEQDKIMHELEKLKECHAIMAENVARFRTSVEISLAQITILLTGNGIPENGLIVQVDRLREAEKRRALVGKLTLGALIASAISWIAALVKMAIK